MNVRFSPDNRWVVSVGGKDRAGMQWRVLSVAQDEVGAPMRLRVVIPECLGSPSPQSQPAKSSMPSARSCSGLGRYAQITVRSATNCRCAGAAAPHASPPKR